MTDKLTAWFVMDAEFPSDKDFHKLRHKILDTGIYKDHIDLGLIMNPDQYVFFMNEALSKFILPSISGINEYFGFKIKVIREF